MEGGGGDKQNHQPGPGPAPPAWMDHTSYTPTSAYLGGGGVPSAPAPTPLVMSTEGQIRIYPHYNYGAPPNQLPNLGSGSPQQFNYHHYVPPYYVQAQMQQQQIHPQQFQQQQQPQLGMIGHRMGGAGGGPPQPVMNRGGGHHDHPHYYYSQIQHFGVGGSSSSGWNAGTYPYSSTLNSAVASPPSTPRQYVLEPYPNPFQRPPLLPTPDVPPNWSALDHVYVKPIPTATRPEAEYWNDGGSQKAMPSSSLLPTSPLPLTEAPQKAPGVTIPVGGSPDPRPEEKPKSPPKVMIGKRRGGSKFLPTGQIKRFREPNVTGEAAPAGADGTGTQDNSKNPEERKWSRYFEEVEKYRNQTCKEENQNHPLVK